MKLKELNQEYQALYDLASDTDDVKTLTELYKQLESKLEEKADNTRLILSKLKSDIDFLSDEIKRLQNRKKSIENNIDNLKSMLMWTFYKAGITKLKTKKATFYFATTTSVKIDDTLDLTKLDKNFVQVEYKVDKKALKEAIESGTKIDGVTIEEKETLRIR